MTYGLDTRSKSDAGDAAGDVEPAAGKRTLTASFPVQRRQVQGASVQAAEASTATPEADPFAVHLPAVQRKGGGGAVDVHAAAEHGISGSGSSLPHLDAIQRSFGGHDVSGIRAHTDSAAAQGSAAMGAAGYATGNDVAFAGSNPDLHLAAHEAAHVVQQRAGVQLSGGVGEVGDVHERHADQVADAVVAGQSAEHLLGNLPSNTSAATTQRSIQSKPAAAAPAAAGPAAPGGVGGTPGALSGDAVTSAELRTEGAAPAGGDQADPEVAAARGAADHAADGQGGGTVQKKAVQMDPGAPAAAATGDGALIRVNTHTASMSSIAWIPESAGLPVHDPEPSATFPSGLVTPPAADYRFCNRFTVTFKVEVYERITRFYASIDDKALIGKTHGIPAQQFATGKGVEITTASGGHGAYVHAHNIVGARTMLPNPGGLNPFGSEPLKFPPIWTQLDLKLYQDGHVDSEVCPAWSHFPMHYVYDHTGKKITNNTPDYTTWMDSGWGAWKSEKNEDGSIKGPNAHTGNPWSKKAWLWE